jgi:hypothetical protein
MTLDEDGFGDCSNHAECEAVRPKESPSGTSPA